MPAFSVSKSVEIDVSIEEVYAYLRDFNDWPVWSPWLICDPECQVDYATDGKSYSWVGEFAGQGEMKLVNEHAPMQLDYDLKFIKPWKSQADVSLNCERADEGTRVTWSMDSKLPFFLFWMKGMMINMLGMDYDRGLRMLKEQLEKHRVSSHLEFKGIESVAGCQYIGIKRECRFEEMEQVMDKDFAKLRNQVTEAHLEPKGPYFTTYKKWQLSKGVVSYEVCCPVAAKPLHFPDGVIFGSRPAVRAYQVEHTGAYQHLANAWSAAMMRSQSKLFKQSKKVMPFEQYLVMPEDAEENQTVTLVCLPVR